MISFRPLLAAAAATFSLATAAFAHDGVHVNDAYARTNGGIGKTGAVFFVVENHQTEDDQLIGVASDIAEKVEFHTHKEGDGGVMQMLAVPEGFGIPAEGEHALARGGDHVMLMGLTRDLKDGDTFTVTLTFEHAGVVEVEVPVDNARKDDGMGMMHHKHGTTDASN